MPIGMHLGAIVAIELDDRGEGNEFLEWPGALIGCAGKIIIHGNHNRILIDKDCRMKSAYIEIIGSHNTIAIEAPSNIGDLHIHACDDASIHIGRESWFNGLTRIFAHEKASITIGEHCLFGGVLIMASDVHSILAEQSGERVNHAGDIHICDHVWMAMEVAVMKGVTIGSGSIIGFRSVVTSDIPANSVAAGHPAKVIRHGVKWTIESVPRILNVSQMAG